ncbi:MAG: radical SAM protein [bacterium]
MAKDVQIKESPEYLRLSLAAAMTLGFRRGRFYRNARLHCLNLLLTYEEGCFANCAYCGLARERSGKFAQKSFIHVEWPVYELEAVLERMDKYGDGLERICISMITNPKARQHLGEIMRGIRARTDLPISLLITPTILDENDLLEFKESGADRVGIAIDAATPDLFERLRGKSIHGPHRWERYWEMVTIALRVFGKGKVGVHLVVGLGETEKEMIAIIQRVHDLGSHTHLFSFFPERGSLLEDLSQPPMGQYRRIQLTRFLIEENMVSFKDFAFEERERIKEFGMPKDRLLSVIDSGLPFMTPGCPGKDGRMACNRPYGNCFPGPNIRNYPFSPTSEDISRIRQQIWDY